MKMETIYRCTRMIVVRRGIRETYGRGYRPLEQETQHNDMQKVQNLFEHQEAQLCNRIGKPQLHLN